MATLLLALALLQDAERPPRVYLGLTFSDRDALQVGNVASGSPAEQAGVRPGDRILALEGKEVQGFDELIDRLRAHKRGDRVVLKLEREGQVIELAVELSERTQPIDDEDPGVRPGFEPPAPKLPPPLKQQAYFKFDAPLEDFTTTAARWKAAEGVLTRRAADSTEATLSVALWDKHSFKDGSISVKLQVVSGETDQAAGLAFRALDPENHYAARVNALQGNVTLYLVRRGTLKPLGSADVALRAATWYVLRVDLRGWEIRVSFDGKEAIRVSDATFADGRAGLWSRADSVAQFDDLLLEPTK